MRRAGEEGHYWICPPSLVLGGGVMGSPGRLAAMAVLEDKLWS